MPAPTTGGTWTAGAGMPTRLSDLAVDNTNSIDAVTGRLIIELAAAAIAGLLGAVRIQDGSGTNLAFVGVAGDANSAQIGLRVITEGLLYNGAALDRSRSASAFNLAAQSGLGAALVAPPGNWSVFSAPAANTLATATRAAGGAGVRHIGVAASWAIVSNSAPAATIADCFIRDGVSGGISIYLDSLSVTAVAGQANNTRTPNVALPGTAATAMTVEFSAAAGASTAERVAATGFDAS